MNNKYLMNVNQNLKYVDNNIDLLLNENGKKNKNMNTRICYQEKVNAGAPQPCTVEKFNELLDSPVVKKICEQIAKLDATAPDYEEKKSALKRRLPMLIPHACAFVNENENKI